MQPNISRHHSSAAITHALPTTPQSLPTHPRKEGGPPIEPAALLLTAACTSLREKEQRRTLCSQHTNPVRTAAGDWAIGRAGQHNQPIPGASTPAHTTHQHTPAHRDAARTGDTHDPMLANSIASIACLAATHCIVWRADQVQPHPTPPKTLTICITSSYSMPDLSCSLALGHRRAGCLCGRAC
jgi:hypothetical protein